MNKKILAIAGSLVVAAIVGAVFILQTPSKTASPDGHDVTTDGHAGDGHTTSEDGHAGDSHQE